MPSHAFDHHHDASRAGPPPPGAAGLRSTAARAAVAIATALALTTGLGLASVLASALSPRAAYAQLHQRTVAKPGPRDREKNRQQRQHVEELARRHLGARIRGARSDVEVLQRLLDGRYVPPEDAYGLQCLGVVLGDALAAELGLRWVVVDDDYGHSRALRDGEREQLYFPVTMISKRVAANERVSMRALYDKVAESVRRERARP